VRGFKQTSVDGKQVLEKRFVALCKLLEMKKQTQGWWAEKKRDEIFHFNFIGWMRSALEREGGKANTL
jgi:hypothetical protein